MLTRKQQELLFFIHDTMKKTGISPSFDEMKKALDLASKSGIHRLITALEERGFIRRLPNRARALEVIRLPQTAFAPSQAGGSRSPALVHSREEPGDTDTVLPYPDRLPGGASPESRSDAGFGGSAPVPLMGRIAAGVPISAIQHKTGALACPADMLGKGEYYALEVKGDSMVNAGILNNDIVIIRRSDTANPGEIIVALVDDVEATLKRYRRRGNSIALEAANPAYETRIFGPDRIKIQGVLVGLLRHY